MTIPEIKEAVRQVRAGEANLIDVRTPEEYQTEHADGSINFDSQRIAAGDVPDLDTDSPVYLYCNSGGRAGRAKLVLENKGFKAVYNLGGLLDWMQAGGLINNDK